MELATGDSATAGATGDVSITTGAATGGNGGDITMNVGDGDTGAGGAVTLTAGKSSDAVGSAVGGALTLAAGMGPRTGGNLYLSAGQGTDVASTSEGGSVYISSGEGVRTSSGDISLSTPDCPTGSQGVSGDISLTTGETTYGTSGSIQLKTSDGNSGVGGDIVLKVGAGNSGKGGQVLIEAGTTSEAVNPAALGGDIYLRGGNSSSENGGTLYLVSGHSNAKNGGNLDLNAGTGNIVMKSATVDITGNTDMSGTLDVEDDFAVNTDKFKVIAGTGAVSMSSAAQTITHDGATSLTISSSQAAAFVKIQGGSAAYVQVESVKITDNKIGTVNDANLITLEDDKMSLDGALDLTVDAATITHTASTGTPTLTISSTNGPVSVVSDAQYVDIESVRFTGDKIGLDGDTAIMQLTTAGSIGNVAVDGTVTMIDDATSLTHTGATSLTISSSQAAAFVKIEGGSAAYVQVESVKITDNQIGTVNDANLITLEDDKMSLDGALDLTVDAATITHTGATSLAISSTNGYITIAGGSDATDYVDVESVRFTGDKIGLDGDTGIMQLTTAGSIGKVTIDGTVEMIDDTTSLTHTGTTSLAISSTNGHITIAGGSDDYVDVESVRFTGDQIGINGDPDLITLTNGVVTINGKIIHSGTTDHTGDFEVGTDKFNIASNTGNTAIAGTLDVTGATSLASTLEVNGTMTVSDNVKLTEDNAVIEHTSTASGASLTIKSNSGYVDVESVRFTGDKIGLDSDTAIMQLTTAGSVGNVAIDGTVTMIDDATSLTHTGATSLAISSTNGHITIAGGSSDTDYVDVESVRFTDDYIGITGDADLVRLEANKVTIKGTLTTTDDILMSEETAALTHDSDTGVGLAITSTNGYVDVEQVRFTDDQIGLAGTEGLVTLSSSGVDIAGSLDTDGHFKVADTKFTIDVSGNTYADGTLGVKGLSTLQNNLELSKTDAAIKHTGTGATTGLTISSDNGYVDVESVRFTDATIGTTDDPGLISLTDTDVTVTGTLTVSDNVKLTEDNAVIEHTSTASGASLTIKSNSGYVDVESVRFTGDKIGLDSDTAIMQLTTDGSVGNVAVDGTVTMIDDATSLTHTGATSLTISSSQAAAFVKIQGGSAAYVQVESVKITDDQIGTVSDANLITLEDDKMSLDGALDLTNEDATITHTGSSGTPTLTISSTSGPVSVVSDAQYVDVESVRFTGDQIGLDGDTAIMQLTTANSVGNVAVDGTVTIIDDATSLTHTGATSLTISSSQAAAFVKIQGGSAAYVQVESVKITDDQIGTVNDANLITLEDDKMSLDGALDLTVDAATITHTGATSLTMSSTSGPVSVVSTAQYVDVESVRFTGDMIGLSGDTAIMQLTTAGSVGNVAVDGTVTMIDDATSLTHTGTTSLAISSTNGHITIAGGSDDYVDVESVRFTGDQIGLDGDTAIMQLTTDGSVGNVAIDGTVTMIDDATSLTHTGTTSLAISSTNGHITIAGGSDDYVDVESVRFTGDKIGLDGDTAIMQLTTAGSIGKVTIDGTVEMIDDTTSLTHTGTTSLAISSTNGHVTIAGGADDYVDVESVRFTDAAIGTTGDADLVTLEDNKVTIKGTLTTTDDILMSEETAALTHDSDTGVGLAITSTNGYVDVEQVRFTDDQIGLAGTEGLVTLSSSGVDIAGSLDTDGHFKVADTKFTIDVSGNTYADGTLGVKGLSTLQNNLELSKTDAAIKHTGTGATTGLTISSDNGYVDVESVRFTDATIGTTDDPGLISLTDTDVTVTGTLTVSDNVKLTEDNAVIEHTSTASGASLTIKSNSGYVDVESVRFTGDKIGLDSDTAIMQLTTDGSVGNVAVDGTVTMIDDATSLTHTGATSLTISSSQAAAFVKIQGGSAAYVQVESVKITDDQIGTVNDANLITLEDDKMSLDGALDLTNEDATITHTGSSGTPTLTISSTNGPVSVVSDAQYVDVESVRFTGDQIGLSGDTAIMQLTTAGSVGNVAIDGTVTMIDDATSLTHTGATSLAISSTNGHITIAGGSDDYVDVESVRFTGDKIGLDSDTAIMQLTTAGSIGNVAIDGTVTMIDDATSLTHTGTTSLAISSTNGHITIAGGSDDYVDVESVRFTNDYIGISTDTDIIQLTSTGSQATVAIVADVDVTGTMDVSSNFEIGTDKFKVVEQTGAVSMISDAQTITHDGATSLTISSSQAAAFVKIQGGSAAYVQVESVKITDNQIGTVSDANLITLEDDKMSLDGALDLKNEDATITHTASTGTPTLTISSTNGPVSVVSDAQYVDIESVRFTGDKIGLDGDTAIMQLTTAWSVGNVAVDGTVTMIDDVTSLTHTGATSLAISSTNGHITIAGGSNDYVDIESVRFTGDKIGLDGDTAIMQLTTAGSVGNVAIDGTVTMIDDATSLTHTGTTSLAISSTNGHITIAGGSDDYVDVESVRFTNDYIGISTDTDIIQLTSTGSQATVAIVADVDVTGTMDVSSNFEIGTDKFKVVEQTGAVSMISDAQTITHDGATSLTISSSQAAAFVKIQGGSAAYVQVESVKITDDQIGTVSDANLITLEDDKMSLDGALDLTNEDATITHTASTGTPTLTISSTNGPVSVVSDAQYVDIESVRFTGDKIGLDGDTAIMQLTTAWSVGNVAVDGTVTMIDDATSLTHTGATSLTISSSQAAAFVKIQGGSAAYVQVESVKITDDQIGTVSDANLITLEDDKMSLDGALDLTNEDATITHTASTGTPMLTISSTNGPVSVVSDAQYVDIESVRFTGDKIGLDGDTAIMQLTTDGSVGNVAVDGTVTMIDDATSLTHTGATSLTISSSQAAAFVKIQGGSAAYVQVESVKITDDQIGTVNDADLITLEDDKMSLDGALDLTVDAATITHTGATSLTMSSTSGPVSVVSDAQYVDVESVRFTGDMIGLSGDTAIMQLTTAGSVGKVKIDGTVEMIDDTTSLTHTGTTSLAISSTNGHITIAGGADDYVDVESVRFTGDKIGLGTDTAIMQLTTAGSVGNVAIDGTVTMIDDVTSLTHTGATSLAISSTNGHITIAGGSNDYVDVESVRITDAAIGTTGDADLITLEDNKVTIKGSLDTDGYIYVAATKFTVDTSGNTYADGTFEVKGVSTLTGAASLSSTLDVNGATSLGSTLSVTGASTLTGAATLLSSLNVSGATALSNTLSVALDATMKSDIIMSDTSATLKHSASSGGLTITSENGYVDVEEVRFTNKKIGINSDADLISLKLGGVTIAGTLDTTGDLKVADTMFVVDAGSGNTLVAGTLGVSSATTLSDSLDVTGVTTLSNTLTVANATTLQSTLDVAGYIKVNANKFTVDVSGNTYVDGTLRVKGVSTLQDDLVLSEDDAKITHTASTGGLTISSTNAHVDVESVRFTGGQIGTTDDPGLISLTDTDVTVTGTLTVSDNVKLTEDNAVIEHTSTASGASLTIKSNSGYVDVESVRFTGDQIGLDGDTAIMQLTTANSVGNVAVDGTVTMIDDATSLTHTGATSLTISSSQAAAFVKIQGGSAAYVQVESVKITDNQIGTVSDANLVTLEDDKMSLDGALDLTNEDATITHTASTGTPMLTISSTSGPVSVVSTAQYVDIESVRFTGDQIGLDGDTAIIQLTTANSVGNVAVDGTVTMIDDATSLTHTGATSLTISSSQAAAFVKIQGGSAAYVQVESVKITDDQIGTVNDADLITLEDDKMSLDGALDLKNEDATITHTASTGTPTLTISSTNGPVSVVSDAQYVDVESVRFTGDQIGLDGDTAIMQLTTAGSVGNVAIDGTVTMIDDVTSLTHTGTTSLAISSTNGHITIAGGSDDYVDVESVRFTNDYIGISTDTDIIQLTSTGSQATVAIVADVDVTGTMDVSSDFEIGTDKFKVVEQTGAVSMISDAQTITHDGATSLTISSSQAAAFVKIEGGSAAYVQVESVKITDNQIGTVSDANLITLEDDKMSLDGALDLKNEDATITHTASTGTPTLTISSTNGPVSVVSDAQYVDIESVRFTGDKIGLDGDTAIMQLTTAGSVGNVAIDGTVTMIDDATSLTHTGATSLAISSTNGHITIAGGSNDYVDIESVRFTNDYIGISTDTDIIQLTSTGSQATVAIVADVDVTGTMDVSSDFAIGTDKFKVVEQTGAVSMISDAQTITHDGATSLTISSSQAAAFVKIEGGSAAYVQVESVKITDNQIGTVSDANLITLEDDKMSLDGALDLKNEDATITHTASTGRRH